MLLNLFLDYYGEYAEDKYRDMHLYDEHGVYMTFRDCHIIFVNYDGSKRIKIANSTMNICRYLDDVVDLIDRKYKVGEDGFFADKEARLC